MDPILETFDDFVDDILSSETNLLKSELDFLLIQHLFKSIDLEIMKDSGFQDNETLVA